MTPVFVIAEAGVNHNGDRDMAFQLIDAAAESGADAVKFQTFKAENLVTKGAVKASYQQQTTSSSETQFAMLKRLELSHAMHHELMEYCEKKKIIFLSTAFDSESLTFLVNDLGLKTLKISSGDITNGPLILEYAQTECDLIVSTGMSTLPEIKQALGVIAFGLIHGKKSSVKPSREAFKSAYASSGIRQLLYEKVTLLHCTSEYPAPAKDINLSAITTMRKTFGLKTGYSDHSEGVAVSVAAVALGAMLIEKHFTLDKNLPGPDHKASLEPDELKTMVDAIRVVEQAIGDGQKGPMPSELGNRNMVRKSLVASSDIKAGDPFTADKISIKRPGIGRSPMDYWDMLGNRSHRDYCADDVIE